MQANDKQFGGQHYKGKEYQHWDFVTDVELPYLLGCATKYVSRWRDKNGLEDLQKGDHYLEKSMERGLEGLEPTDDNVRCVMRFIGQLGEAEAEIIYDVCIGNFVAARAGIQTLMSTEQTATS